MKSAILFIVNILILMVALSAIRSGARNYNINRGDAIADYIMGTVLLLLVAFT